MTDPSYFDQRARTWDQNPNRIKMARAVVMSIQRVVTIKPAMTMIDFGCGSGLMTLQLADQVQAVTAMDTSRGMLEVLQSNLNTEHMDNVTTVYLDPPGATPAVRPVDLIVSTMVFHHIEDIASTLARLHSWLNPGGYLAISDLEPEDGHFHGPEAGKVHHGLDPRALKTSMEKLGMTVLLSERVHEIERTSPEGQSKTYPVFLLVAQKQA